RCPRAAPWTYASPTVASTRRAPAPPPTPSPRPRATRQETTMSETRRDPQELSYGEARDALVEVVRTLEQGGTTRGWSRAPWARGAGPGARGVAQRRAQATGRRDRRVRRCRRRRLAPGHRARRQSFGCVGSAVRSDEAKATRSSTGAEP